MTATDEKQVRYWLAMAASSEHMGRKADWITHERAFMGFAMSPLGWAILYSNNDDELLIQVKAITREMRKAFGL